MRWFYDWDLTMFTGTLVILIALFVWGCIAAIPYWIANERGHPNADAIKVCCIIGFFLPIFWLVAIVWAYTKKA